jgi:hypothetical protein
MDFVLLALTSRFLHGRNMVVAKQKLEHGAEPHDPPFVGSNRRRHRMFVTKNTEYHFRDGFCVAVRDRRTGKFLQGHLALRRRVQGGLRVFPNGALLPNPGHPKEGEGLCFLSGGRDLVTSPIERIDRPSPELVAAYPPMQKSAQSQDDVWDENAPVWDTLDADDENDFFA